MERRRALWGYAFISLWLIGTAIFFIVPMVQSVMYTFLDLEINDFGQLVSEPAGTSVRATQILQTGESDVVLYWEHYRQLFWYDTYFLRNLWDSIRDMVLNVPVIVSFALFTAVILKEKFFGRTIARALFFFPVIIASGVVMSVLNDAILAGEAGQLAAGSTGQEAQLFQAPDIVTLFANMGIPEGVLEFVRDVLNRLFDLTWKSGVQILLLLAAVNSIPKSAYEAADIEGATGWEKFWKITFPMVSPTLVVTVIYTMIDSFTDHGNPIIMQASDAMERGLLSRSTTIGFVYFLVVLAVIGLVYFLINKLAFYENDRVKALGKKK